MTVPVSPPARIVVADPHALMREGIERRLTAAGLVVVGMVSTVAAALESFDRMRPDLVVAAHFFSDGSGLSLLRQLRAAGHADVRMLMLSSADDKALIAAYLTEGASGFLHKSVDGDEFVNCVRTALAGNRALDAIATARVLETLADPTPAGSAGSLSRREVEVLALVADGNTNDDIAQKLFISPQTVKTHLSRIFGKLGVRDRASAAVRATREGILS